MVLDTFCLQEARALQLNVKLELNDYSKRRVPSNVIETGQVPPCCYKDDSNAIAFTFCPATMPIREWSRLMVPGFCSRLRRWTHICAHFFQIVTGLGSALSRLGIIRFHCTSWRPLALAQARLQNVLVLHLHSHAVVEKLLAVLLLVHLEARWV